MPAQQCIGIFVPRGTPETKPLESLARTMGPQYADDSCHPEAKPKDLLFSVHAKADTQTTKDGKPIGDELSCSLTFAEFQPAADGHLRIPGLRGSIQGNSPALNAYWPEGDGDL